MRNAFSMLTAIFVIVILSSLSLLILNISAKTVKNTTTQYRQEQAILYAKSYTELAILYATANDAQSGLNCAEDINGFIGGDAIHVKAGEGYRVQVRISYIGNSLQCSTPSRVLNNQAININEPNELQMIVDVYVQYRDPDVVAALGGAVAANTPWMTYHRRTLQKL